jgi:hypothetical protein
VSYENLSDEAKLEQAIQFIAAGQPLPQELVDFLVAENLYDAVCSPPDTPQ